eukprot:gene16119-17744_t
MNSHHVLEDSKRPLAENSYCLGLHGKLVLSDPCFAYSTLSDASRDINEMSSCSGTDTTLYGWYRFTGSAGEKMLDYCPYNYNNFECGAFVKGWLQGRLPETYEGEVYRFVYFAKTTNCYLDSRQIKVKNCGAFYIYKLSGVPSYHYCKLPKGPISTTMLVLIAGVGLLAIIIIVLIVKMRRRDAPQSAAVVKQSKSPVEEIGIDNAPNGKEFVISDEVTSSSL